MFENEYVEKEKKRSEPKEKKNRAIKEAFQDPILTDKKKNNAIKESIFRTQS